jgi:hypothetical protein
MVQKGMFSQPKEVLMKRLAGCFLLMGLWAGTGTWAANPYPSTPKALVETYTRLDAEAAGLSPSTWPELGQYTNFPQAPKWDRFIVIDRYEIGNALEGHTRAQVRVLYHTLGQFADKFTPDTQPEKAIFYLTKSQDQWKVDSPIMPHVSFEVVKRRLTAASAADPKQKKTNDALLQQIESARAALK